MNFELQGVDNNLKNKGNEFTLKACYSVFLALYPIFCIYKAFFRFTIGDVILMAFTGLVLIKLKKDSKIRNIMVFLPFVTYILLQFLVLIIANTSTDSTIMFRMIKFVFYVFCVVITTPWLLDFNIFKKWMIRGSLFSSVVVFFQYISYYVFGKIFLARIPFLTIYLSEYNQIDYDRFYDYQFRPSSLFLEPAIVCQYLVVGLVLLLFSKKESFSSVKKWLYTAIIVSAMLLSTSAQGVVYIILVAVTVLVLKSKNAVMFAVSGGFLSVISGVIYLRFPALQKGVERLLYNENAANARFGAIDILKEITEIETIFGLGYGNVPKDVYTTGAVYVLYGCGIIGFVLVCIMFFSAFKRGMCAEGKMCCILFFVMLFGTSLFYNYMVFWYFSLILYLNSNEKEIVITNENTLHSGGVSP